MTRPQPSSGLLRYASLGLELGAAIVGLTLAGLWVDHQFGYSPFGTVTGALLGVVGGLYNFLRAALQMNAREAGKSRDDRDA